MDVGSTLVESAGETMAEIVSAVTRVTDIMGEIASASDEQSRGIDQVGLAVAEMDRVTQQTPRWWKNLPPPPPRWRSRPVA